jgi:LmbE family N-acetylglucosaminyl deacetylase
MTTTVVVSPHLDDAVLSLGGSIARWTAAGRRVVIATVYTAGPALAELSPRMRKFADYATRRAEDAAACAVLGAEPLCLDQTERAFRPPFLTGWSFFTTPASPAGFTALASVTRALDAIGKLDPEAILVPLGVGNHVDHVETLVAAVDWATARGLRDRVRFYEDFYALSPVMRRAHPVAATRRWPGWQAPLARSPRLRAILETVATRRAGPSIEHYLGPQIWTAEPSSPDEPRKLAAIACYRSQVRIFGGMAGIARAYRRYHAWWEGEPLWSAVRVE